MKIAVEVPLSRRETQRFWLDAIRTAREFEITFNAIASTSKIRVDKAHERLNRIQRALVNIKLKLDYLEKRNPQAINVKLPHHVEFRGDHLASESRLDRIDTIPHHDECIIPDSIPNIDELTLPDRTLEEWRLAVNKLSLSGSNDIETKLAAFATQMQNIDDLFFFDSKRTMFDLIPEDISSDWSNLDHSNADEDDTNFRYPLPDKGPEGLTSGDYTGKSPVEQLDFSFRQVSSLASLTSEDALFHASQETTSHEGKPVSLVRDKISAESTSQVPLSNNISIPPPPPPPPQPPILQVSTKIESLESLATAKNAKLVRNISADRSLLMESIRNAGGALSLRTAPHRYPVRQSSSNTSNSSTGNDFMGALKQALKLRREGIASKLKSSVIPQDDSDAVPSSDDDASWS